MDPGSRYNANLEFGGKVFPLESVPELIHNIARLHIAINDGAASPLVLPARTTIETDEEFRLKLTDLLKDMTDLIRSLALRPPVVEDTPIEVRSSIDHKMGFFRYLAVRYKVGTKSTASNKLRGGALFVVCDFQYYAAHPFNAVVWKLQSTPNWPHVQIQRDFMLQNSMLLSLHHLGKPQYQERYSPQSREASQIGSDQESSSDSEEMQESEVRTVFYDLFSLFSLIILIVMLFVLSRMEMIPVKMKSRTSNWYWPIVRSICSLRSPPSRMVCMTFTRFLVSTTMLP